MDYEVTGMEDTKTTSTGKMYRFVSLSGQQGEQFPKVKIWQNFDDGRTAFAFVKVGDKLMGEISHDEKWGDTLNPSKPKASLDNRFAKGGQAKTAAIGAAMERKEASIEKFQDSKEYGIRLASTMGGAVNLVSARIHAGEKLDYKKEVLVARKFLWDSWVNVTNDQYPHPDSNDVPFA